MKACFIQSFNKIMYASLPHLVALAAIATFYILGGDLSLPMIFQTLALLFTARYEVIEMLPMLIQLTMEAHVGLKRIEV